MNCKHTGDVASELYQVVLRNNQSSYAKYSHVSDTNTNATTSLLAACVRNVYKRKETEHPRINRTRASRGFDTTLESRVIARRFLRVTIYEPIARHERDPHQQAVGGHQWIPSSPFALRPETRDECSSI